MPLSFALLSRMSLVKFTKRPSPLNSAYVGRFAPSPSGPLHLGSLTCALASYLDARKHCGRWLVRIEDIDPPREQTGADKIILNALQAHGLYWDEEVLYQSSRSNVYSAELNKLHELGYTYYCTCTRARLKELAHQYDGKCRSRIDKPKQPSSIRLNLETLAHKAGSLPAFNDRIQGRIAADYGVQGDFVVHRKDQLFAYNLAVVVDDLAQGVTDIVRGVDLLDSSNQQRLLHSLMSSKPIRYAHIPVLVDDEGVKLSKQNHAPALDNALVTENLRIACRALGLLAPDNLNNPENLLAWAVDKWQPERLNNLKRIALPALL